MDIDAVIAELANMGFDAAVAVATKAEVESGAACGQLALVAEAAPTLDWRTQS